MLSLDPRPDLFRTRLPDEFFDDDIMKKYDVFTKRREYTFDDFKTVINHSIQSIDIPAFGVNVSFQEQLLSDGFAEKPVVQAASIHRGVDNTFTLTIRHTEAYMTYWCLVEHWFKRNQLGPNGNRKPFEFLLLEVLDYKQQSIAKLEFEKVLFTGVDGLSLAYNQVDRVSNTFSVSFSYASLKPKFSIPELRTT